MVSSIISDAFILLFGLKLGMLLITGVLPSVRRSQFHKFPKDGPSIEVILLLRHSQSITPGAEYLEVSLETTDPI
jgi:hypothetical protein